jgi:hypothetical protein
MSSSTSPLKAPTQRFWHREPYSQRLLKAYVKEYEKYVQKWTRTTVQEASNDFWQIIGTVLGIQKENADIQLRQIHKKENGHLLSELMKQLNDSLQQLPSFPTNRVKESPAQEPKVLQQPFHLNANPVPVATVLRPNYNASTNPSLLIPEGQKPRHPFAQLAYCLGVRGEAYDTINALQNISIGFDYPTVFEKASLGKGNMSSYVDRQQEKHVMIQGVARDKAGLSFQNAANHGKWLEARQDQNQWISPVTVLPTGTIQIPSRLWQCWQNHVQTQEVMSEFCKHISIDAITQHGAHHLVFDRNDVPPRRPVPPPPSSHVEKHSTGATTVSVRI